MDLVERVLAGERLALARLLTQVENDTPLGREALDRLFPYAGRAHLIGITGAPGTGKSSLANRLAMSLRAYSRQKVAVLAVDPSSPFSGGALLGDRVRMKDAAVDPEVFIRSMASRGALGGLARATAASTQVLDAAGYAYVLIETVGAGQSEVDIARLAHTVIVVDAPGLGDDIQAIKAGILEIADLLVVNKADLEGAENTVRGLRAMLEIAYPQEQVNQWRPLLLKAIASSGEGIAEIQAGIEAHRRFLDASGGWRRREIARLEAEFDVILQAEVFKRWKVAVGEGRVDDVSRRIARREISPFRGLKELLGQDK